MPHVLKNKTNRWQPTASMASLHQRAALITRIRHFFAERQVLEVETPLLAEATVTDPYVIGIPAFYQARDLTTREMFLQTSPEYAMKRLLAAGSGPIFQISKAFRQGDKGRLHHPEFTMLEWYRLDFTHHDLMNEVDQLLQCILFTPPAEKLSYADVFKTYLDINPHTISLSELISCLEQQAIHVNFTLEDRDVGLDLLLTHCIEPYIGKERPIFIYDFPASQAALSQLALQEDGVSVASRFELYFKGIELANGFHELQNVAEQRQRFMQDNQFREKNNMPVIALDEDFLAALEQGLPNCAGVALGVDRLVLLALDLMSLSDVMSFAVEF